MDPVLHGKRRPLWCGNRKRELVTYSVSNYIPKKDEYHPKEGWHVPVFFEP